jgi:sarcosine oxidase subunit beta
MRSARVVIIGGGIMGASAAYHLALRGCNDIVVLDAAASPGLGSTGAATGGFRAQFATEVNVRLSLMAREYLLRFERDTGINPEYLPAGYLFLARSSETLESLRAGVKVQCGAGVSEVRQITPEEAADINPKVNLEGVIGGTFCALDGFTRPLKLLEGFRIASERLGVRFRQEVEVSGFKLEGSRIAAAFSDSETFAGDVFVNAAGAWAGKLGALAHCEVPVVPVLRHVAVTHPTVVLPPGMPMTVFADDGFHVRVRDGRALLIWTTEQVPEPSFDTAVDVAWLHAIYARALTAFPALIEAPLDVASSWAGLYEMSPDKTAVLGKAEELDNFYLINGSSGHGVMHSPALGKLLSEIILDGTATSMDTAALSPGRFRHQGVGVPKDVL